MAIRCPKNKCQFRTAGNLDSKWVWKQRDCGNEGSQFCPRSKYPWFRHGVFVHYPPDTDNWSWCDNVWRHSFRKYADEGIEWVDWHERYEYEEGEYEEGEYEEGEYDEDEYDDDDDENDEDDDYDLGNMMVNMRL